MIVPAYDTQIPDWDGEMLPVVVDLSVDVDCDGAAYDYTARCPSTGAVVPLPDREDDKAWAYIGELLKDLNDDREGPGDE